MLFLSLLPSTSNIARLNVCCSAAFVQKCLFWQYSDSKAYLPGSSRIKTCNSEYVKGWQLWIDSDRIEPKSNSRDFKWSMSILK